MIFFLFGEDTYRSRAKKRELVDGFKQKRDPTGMNVVVFDCSKEKEERVFEELLAAPFLAEKRMVVLEGLLALKKSSLQKTFLQFLEEKKLPETTILVLWEQGSTFKGDAAKLFDVLKQEKYAQEFETIKGKELEKWIQNEVTTRGGKIDAHAVQFIASNTQDSWLIHSLIDQLLAYSSGEIIIVEHVKIFLREAVDDNIFNLVDAIIARKSDVVFQMIEEQYYKGEDAQYIFAMMTRQFKIMLQMKDAIERSPNEPSEVLAKKLGLHPFVFKKTIPLLRSYSFDQLRKIYEELLEIDVKTKTGQGEATLLIDFFVGKLCLH